MNVTTLLKKINIKRKHHCHKIAGIEKNSLNVKENYIFVAIKGNNFNGHDYIEEAIECGAKTIFYEEKIIIKRRNINYIKVQSTKKILAEIVNIYYKNISEKINIIGITGTNGKTTTTTILYNFFSYMGKKTLLIGSNGIYYNEGNYDTTNTTPDILVIMNYIKYAIRKKYKYCVMEISSHSIKELRVYGIDFNVLVFTNLTHDHLNYHKTIDDYRSVKGQVFNKIKKLRKNKVILNTDDEYFKYFFNISTASILTYGIKNDADFMAYDITKSMDGNEFKVLTNNILYRVFSGLIGEFNIYNILGAMCVVDAYKYELNDFVQFLKVFDNVPGRMEMIKYNNVTYIVDYAHTPDSVDKVLNTISQQNPKKITCVIGCGGLRDSMKREVIGNITTKISDFVIFTNDNPRNEDPMRIINDILRGVQKNNYKVILNRKEAIKYAVEHCKKNEVIAILGRGNEKIQKVNGENINLEDAKWLRKCLGMVG